MRERADSSFSARAATPLPLPSRSTFPNAIARRVFGGGHADEAGGKDRERVAAQEARDYSPRQFLRIFRGQGCEYRIFRLIILGRGFKSKSDKFFGIIVFSLICEFLKDAEFVACRRCGGEPLLFFQQSCTKPAIGI